MKLTWSLVLSSAATAAASYAGNLNYRSPSENHPGLGISVHRVVKRGNPGSAFDPSNLHFTHGVASGDPYPDSVILWTRCSPTYDDVHSNSSTMGLVPLYNPVPIYEDHKNGHGKGLGQGLGNEQGEGSDNGQGNGAKVTLSVSDSQDQDQAMSNAPVCLNYMVSEDESFKHAVSEGTVYTSSDVDYTVKVRRCLWIETRKSAN